MHKLLYIILNLAQSRRDENSLQYFRFLYVKQLHDDPELYLTIIFKTLTTEMVHF